MGKSEVSTGMFITLEGGDGTGKSTQAALLQEFLKSRSIDPVMTREPGGAPGANEIRELLLTGEPDRWDAVGETLLFYASRRNNLRLTIWPALEAGQWVICDRFADSTLAYQGFGNQLGLDAVKPIHEFAVGSFEPDLTFVLDIDPATGIGRTQGRAHNEDRFEKMDLSFHERLRQGFLTLAELYKHRCVVINAEQSVEDIQAAMQQVLIERFSL
ncbi:dTMP kinase [Sneathiella chinensis]|uniref:Thymidylate kinase n=1 Tax=Sneathiella chinensis TaxID=349750 RepID=A0ABQ5U570_9PROT|nr:dTMP kinase [Sneathiella chinensis]GLQ07267.1 thymidylate kinase [Sneathiella chinensis]